MHIHIGVLFALMSFLNVIVIGFFWRFASMKYHSTALGQAMAFIY